VQRSALDGRDESGGNLNDGATARTSSIFPTLPARLPNIPAQAKLGRGTLESKLGAFDRATRPPILPDE